MALRDQDLEHLRSTLRGAVLTPNDGGYDEVRRVWNGMFDRRPEVIARCAGAADVVAAVNFGREHGLLVAVRGGGHSFPGHSVCDGGLMIDLSPMKGIRIDARNRTARAEPGVLWGEFDREAQAFGLATTGGMISHTGIAGLTLGGGFGWLCRKHGMTVDNLLSCDVVTADGRLLRAAADENADLFWGLRGGGGNFGVVTSFEYRLHELGQVLGGLVGYPLEEAAEVIPRYAALLAEAPEDFIAGCFLLTTPDGHRAVGVAPVYLGRDANEGRRLVEPYTQLGTVVMQQVGPLPYATLQTLVDAAAVPHRRYYMRSNFLADPGAAAAVLAKSYAETPSPFSAVILFPLGGAVARGAPDATAFHYRDAAYSMTLLGCWESASEDAENIAWVRSAWERLGPYLSEGVYVNELLDEGAERVRSAYGPGFERLQALKRRYDPENFFRLNQNVTPG